MSKSKFTKLNDIEPPEDSDSIFSEFINGCIVYYAFLSAIISPFVINLLAVLVYNTHGNVIDKSFEYTADFSVFIILTALTLALFIIFNIIWIIYSIARTKYHLLVISIVNLLILYLLYIFLF